MPRSSAENAAFQVLRQPQGNALPPLRRVVLRDVGNEEEDVELAAAHVEKGDDTEENAPGRKH